MDHLNTNSQPLSAEEVGNEILTALQSEYADNLKISHNLEREEFKASVKAIKSECAKKTAQLEAEISLLNDALDKVECCNDMVKLNQEKLDLERSDFIKTMVIAGIALWAIVYFVPPWLEAIFGGLV